MRTASPSHQYQTGTLCGLPSGRVVASQIINSERSRSSTCRSLGFERSSIGDPSSVQPDRDRQRFARPIVWQRPARPPVVLGDDGLAGNPIFVRAGDDLGGAGEGPVVDADKDT